MDRLDKISLFCFGASYALALALEVLHFYRPRPVLRVVGLGCGSAGLLAQTIYLGYWQPPLGWQFGTLLALAWVLAIFYLIGSLHHTRQPLGLFVLPVVLGLVGAAGLFGPPLDEGARLRGLFRSDEERWWLGLAHGLLLVLAAVGVCVAFVASLMYLVQAHRLKEKQLPRQGLRLPSLERLEAMNRRALNLALPLLAAGVIFGVLLMARAGEIKGWTDARVLGTVPLVLTLAVLLYLRSIHHLRGRRVAFLTIMAFAMLVVTLVLPHMGRGGPP